MTDTEKMRADVYGRRMADGAWAKADPQRRRGEPRPSARSLAFEGYNALENERGDATKGQLRAARTAVGAAFRARWRELQAVAVAR